MSDSSPGRLKWRDAFRVTCVTGEGGASEVAYAKPQFTAPTCRPRRAMPGPKSRRPFAAHRVRPPPCSIATLSAVLVELLMSPSPGDRAWRCSASNSPYSPSSRPRYGSWPRRTCAGWANPCSRAECPLPEAPRHMGSENSRTGPAGQQASSRKGVTIVRSGMVARRPSGCSTSTSLSSRCHPRRW